MVIPTWVSDRYIFKKKNEENLSFQGKPKAVFIASNKIQAFKQKLQVCKACFHHVSLIAS